MPPKSNPLGLNPLQLKTLTLFQALAAAQGEPGSVPGEIVVKDLPRPHGDHFHIGNAVAMTSDATGLQNEAVWKALERKGLLKAMFPMAVLMTEAGLAYETGLADRLLHRSHH